MSNPATAGFREFAWHELKSIQLLGVLTIVKTAIIESSDSSTDAPEVGGVAHDVEEHVV